MKIFIDFDCTLVDTISAVCHMYNEDYVGHKDFKIAKPRLVQEYNFSDQCPLLGQGQLNDYFSSERFFKYLKMFEKKEILYELNLIAPVYIITIGTSHNISYKAQYIEKNYPNTKSIYISQAFDDPTHKTIINMYDSIFVDDYLPNLDTSNAKIKFVYGIEKKYNRTRSYERIYSLSELLEDLKNG